jgi:hypothetical protein
VKLQTRRARKRRELVKRVAIGIFAGIFFIGAVGVALIVSVSR